MVSTSTNGIKVDMTPPVLRFLGDGKYKGQDMDYTASPDSFTINYDFVDKESGVASYGWAVFESVTATISRQVYPPPHNVTGNFDWAHVNSTSNTVTAHNITLYTGAHYFAKIVATNVAGLSVKYETDGMIVDLTPPKVRRLSPRYCVFSHHISVYMRQFRFTFVFPHKYTVQY